jgi:hypothetical protein
VQLVWKTSADSLYREIQELRRQITKLQKQLKLATQYNNDQVSAYASPAQSNGSVQTWFGSDGTSRRREKLAFFLSEVDVCLLWDQQKIYRTFSQARK